MSNPTDDLLDEAREAVQTAIQKISTIVRDDLLKEWTPAFRDNVYASLARLTTIRDLIKAS